MLVITREYLYQDLWGCNPSRPRKGNWSSEDFAATDVKEFNITWTNPKFGGKYRQDWQNTDRKIWLAGTCVFCSHRKASYHSGQFQCQSCLPKQCLISELYARITANLRYPAKKKHDSCTCQWPFQEPKLEVPTIYKPYIRPKFQGIPIEHCYGHPGFTPGRIFCYRSSASAVRVVLVGPGNPEPTTEPKSWFWYPEHDEEPWDFRAFFWNMAVIENGVYRNISKIPNYQFHCP